MEKFNIYSENDIVEFKKKLEEHSLKLYYAFFRDVSFYFRKGRKIHKHNWEKPIKDIVAELIIMMDDMKEPDFYESCQLRKDIESSLIVTGSIDIGKEMIAIKRDLMKFLKDIGTELDNLHLVRIEKINPSEALEKIGENFETVSTYLENFLPKSLDFEPEISLASIAVIFSSLSSLLEFKN